jgi:hypothetical protein
MLGLLFGHTVLPVTTVISALTAGIASPERWNRDNITASDFSTPLLNNEFG